MLDVATLVAAARERVGYDDFGDDTWREGLGVLVRALSTEGDLSATGEHVFADQIVGYLANRLEIERWYASHPEIDEQEIVAPLFGLGLPRTGSTALSFLLASDRSRRSLRTWEASTPCPPPETAAALRGQADDVVSVETPAPLSAIGQWYAEFSQTSDAEVVAHLISVSYRGDLAAAVRATHEAWDGSGYPDGLTGEEIPLTARIVSVVDAYEAAH